MFRAQKQPSQVTAPNQTPHGSPTSAATKYKDTAIMPTSKAEALTLSPTSGPFRAHDSHPGHSPDFCFISITLRNITRKELAVIKRKTETLPISRNVDNANMNHSSENRQRGERAESPRDEDRLFVTPDPEDPHRYTYAQQEVIESAEHVPQNHDTNESNTETTQDQSSNVQKTLNMAQLLALPAGPIVAPIAYPVIARTTRGYVAMTQQQVENQEGVFRKATYQCLHPECDNKKGQGYASEVSRAKHWRRAHERGYSQYPGGMRGLQPFTVL
ncbi:MAG: Uncharacterized protein AUREO_050460 [Aureobasidium pullulans]|nr:MAG: Uncharacterized protein AUREO_050460 [Aureobasidium pullulans]